MWHNRLLLVSLVVNRFFFFKQKTAYEIMPSLVGSEMCIRDRYEGWSGLEGTLWPRLVAQVLEPLRRGRPGRYKRYDWVAGAFADWVDVPVPDVLVLEGCGAARRASEPDAVLSVWVEAPAALRLARGLERDGEAMRDEWIAWSASEAAHFDRERTRERAGVRLDAYGR